MTSPIQEAVNAAMLRGVRTHSRGSNDSSADEVVALVTNHVLESIRPEVEKRVRLLYHGLANRSA